jgi:hypothetical protein
VKVIIIDIDNRIRCTSLDELVVPTDLAPRSANDSERELKRGGLKA